MPNNSGNDGNDTVQIEAPAVNVSLFSPASYNLPQFKYKHLPTSEVRNAWTSWIRWFESVMGAANVTDGEARKLQLMAMGGLELQSAFYSLPESETPDQNSYVEAKKLLNQHFAPKHHESFERFLFHNMKPESDETIDKFVLKIQQKAEKCCFGKTETDSRHAAVIDKIIQFAPEELRQKLLEKEPLVLDDAIKTVNAYQSVRYQSAKMNNKPVESNVNRLYSDSRKFDGKQNQRRDRGCRQCGYLYHKVEGKCPAAAEVCKRCNKVGHFWSVCTTKVAANARIGRSETNGSLYFVTTTNTLQNDPDLFFISKIVSLMKIVKICLCTMWEMLTTYR